MRKGVSGIGYYSWIFGS